jgi:hypothetical protein
VSAEEFAEHFTAETLATHTADVCLAALGIGPAFAKAATMARVEQV